MKKRYMISIAGMMLGLVAAGMIYFSLGAKASAGPVVVEDIQYPFEKGGGLVNVAIENVFMGVGMLSGERKKGDTWTTLTGSVNFELMSKKAQARLQVDRIRLIERTGEGEDGRVFEPLRVYDADETKGGTPDIQFLEARGKFPFVWENGKSDCVYFVFEDFPLDVNEADLVITYNGKFPDKKHIAYYEDRLSVKRKTYFRNR